MIGIELKAPKVVEPLERLSQSLMKAAVGSGRATAKIYHRAILEAVSAKHGGGTGALKESFRVEVESERKKAVKARVVSDAPQAEILSRGGRINGALGMLAIPLEEGLPTASESTRDLVAITSRAGNLLLAEVSGRQVRPQYLLRDSVDIPGSGYLEDARIEGDRRALRATSAAIRAAAKV